MGVNGERVPRTQAVGGMIHTGDCIEVMAGMPADSVDAVVTDPPYNLSFMGKSWDAFGKAAKQGGEYQGSAWRPHAPNAKAVSGYIGNGARGLTIDQSSKANVPFQAWCEAWGREALRVTKPGGYLLAFGGTRTHHRLVCGLEDAGWIIRDELTWVYASGFPKGRANLKPAHEPIVLARKPGPLRPLNIEESRIGTAEIEQHGRNGDEFGFTSAEPAGRSWSGRWPSNLLLSDPALFDEPNPYVVGSGATSTDGVAVLRNGGGMTPSYSDSYSGNSGLHSDEGYGGAGGYSRFFAIPRRGDVQESGLEGEGFRRSDGESQSGDASGPAEGDYPSAFIIPKADRADREPLVTPDGHDRSKRFSTHPTVKPTDLMRHLVRLVTPIGGTVLDCFAGSGSTLIAAEMEGFAWIGIEQDASYVAIAEARLNGVQRGLGLDVGAPTKRPPGRTGEETGKPRVSYTNRNAPKGWGGGPWAEDPDEEPAA